MSKNIGVNGASNTKNTSFPRNNLRIVLISLVMSAQFANYFEDPDDQFSERTPTRTGRTGHAHYLAWLNLEINPLQGRCSSRGIAKTNSAHAEFALRRIIQFTVATVGHTLQNPFDPPIGVARFDDRAP